MMDMRAYAKAKALIEQPDVDEDALHRAGVPDNLIAEVMDNIERRRREKGAS